VKVKIIGITGSPRKGNTDILVNECLKGAAELKDVETEFLALSDYRLDGGCTACMSCFKKPDPELLCHHYQEKDDGNKILRKVLAADGFIWGSPVYLLGMTSQFKMFIDRCEPIQALGGLRNRVIGAVTCATARNGGQEYVILELLKAAMMMKMIPVGIPVWPAEGIGSPLGVAGRQGWPKHVPTISKESLTAVRQDVIAMGVTKFLGKRVAEMAKVIKAGFTLCNPENGETEWPYGPIPADYLTKVGDLHHGYKR